MILPKMRLEELQSKQLEYSGIDSPDLCLDKEYFKSYKHSINYIYNDRGFRDDEWPDDQTLKDCIWCVGDSFTTGLGSPITHTWPNILQQKTTTRTINISMDGASNNWIARQTNFITKYVKPKNLVVMWSYFHRREIPTTALKKQTYMSRRVHSVKDQTYKDDLFNFTWNYNSVENNKYESNVIHLIIPDATDKDYLIIPNRGTCLGIVNQIDYARDRWHFDILTATNIVDTIIPYLAK